MFSVDDEESGATQVDFPRMEWRDVPQHVALSLNKQDGWELESVKKAQKTRAAKDEE
ncbi:MAG: hypothetical protein M3Q68_06865 [Actinomycetota bacterium]|nr:hypothetical protein [Actinomycetota bacterium]